MNNTAESNYDRTLDRWGKTQQYKKVKLHPISILDEDIYLNMLNLLARSKMIYRDKDIIKSNYLAFVVIYLDAVFINEGKTKKEFAEVNIVEDLEKLLVYIFGYKKCVIEKANLIPKPIKISDYKVRIVIPSEHNKDIDEDIIITGTDFDNIREMILEQNGLSIEYVNEYNEDLEKKIQILNKTSVSANLEEQQFSFCTAIGKTIDEIDHYTYYQFKKHFERVEIDYEYRLFKPLESSGQIKVKNGTIKHWLTSIPKKGRYSSILIKKSSFEKNSDIMKVSKKK